MGVPRRFVVGPASRAGRFVKKPASARRAYQLVLGQDTVRRADALGVVVVIEAGEAIADASIGQLEEVPAGRHVGGGVVGRAVGLAFRNQMIQSRENAGADIE